ncbi:MAG: 3'-5' exonuclease, partial [Candidatus Peribacteraceae bacterium]|jgi:DNA polymerase-3 subunit epsilon
MSPFPPLTVFDVETTGLDPRRGHRIIEIAGVRVENGIIQEEHAFVSLVNPERPIPPEAAQINHIREEDVQKAPTIDQVLPQFLSFASGSMLVAHNADFDMGFLLREKELCWGYVELPECLCTMRLSQAVYPHEFRHSLDVVSQRLGLELPKERHRALPDVVLTAKALLIMIQTGKITSVDQLREKASIRQMV